MTQTNDAVFWSRAARKYAASKISDMAGYERTVERTRALLSPAAHVLELGCGTGTTALTLAPSAATYLATDIAPGMIEIAEEKLAAAPRPNLTFKVATAGQLAGEAPRFDAVLGFNYLHLVENLDDTLSAIARLTVPGGLFISKTPCLTEMTSLLRLAVAPMRWIGKAPAHVGFFSVETLKLAITTAGFEIVHEERHGSGKKDVRPFLVMRRR